MSNIAAVLTKNPPFVCSNEQLLLSGEQWLKNKPAEYELFKRFVDSCKIQNRAYVIPVTEMLLLGGLSDRAELFLSKGEELASALLKDLFKNSPVPACDIDSIVFTSCTSPTIPSLDVRLINQEALGFSRSVRRAPVFQYGCAGGVAGLSLAHALSKSGENVLLLSVEFCSLVFQSADTSIQGILGSTLFSDGATALVVTPNIGKFKILSAKTELLPGAETLMGYDLKDDGLHLRLDRSLPERLMLKAPHIIENFLKSNSLTLDDVKWWLFHPGGAKILKSLENCVAKDTESSQFAWDVLRDHGNMSSASILFVLEKFISSKVYKSGDLAFMLGIGPGLSVECLLIECL